MTHLLNKNRSFVLCLACAGVLLAADVSAKESVSEWLDSARREALAQGVSAETFDRALANFEPLDYVIELDRKQPESTKTFNQYLDTVVSSSRISDGRKFYKKHKTLLTEVSERYGVPPNIIVALWGVETNYGTNTGSTSVIDALATLAWDGRRRELFQGELISALKIIENKDVPLQRMEGSWAGAMGQSQFMPSSFLRYAVDYDRDGKRDIWHTLPDVFASIANYLSQNDWDRYETWGIKVMLADGMSQKFYGSETRKTLDEWRQAGAEPISAHLPRPDTRLEIVLPERMSDVGYLVTPNYKVLLRWNRSRYFATSVGMLAETIVQGE